MSFYPIILTIHILCAGVWLVTLIAEGALKKQISGAASEEIKTNFIRFYLQFVNKLGSIGAMGVLLTGIVMVTQNPGYGFFEFSTAHWLVSKQIIMILILVLIFAKIIPTAKKVRLSIENNEGNTEELLSGLYKINSIVNIFLIINLLFALSRNFM